MWGLNIRTEQLPLLLPFFLSLWMAWSDIRTQRIPNYLTYGCAIAGLVYHLGLNGWVGGGTALLGLVVGFALLIIFYWRGGIGAGDVKALAALGAWLGPEQTLFLFCYMAFSGVLITIAYLWWKGLLWAKLGQFWHFLVGWVLLRPHTSVPESSAHQTLEGEGIPYAVALAAGMAIVCWREILL